MLIHQQVSWTTMVEIATSTVNVKNVENIESCRTSGFVGTTSQYKLYPPSYNVIIYCLLQEKCVKLQLIIQNTKTFTFLANLIYKTH